MKVDGLGRIGLAAVPDGIALVEVFRLVEPAEMAEVVVIFVVEKGEFALAEGKLLHGCSSLKVLCCGSRPMNSAVDHSACRSGRRKGEFRRKLTGRPCLEDTEHTWMRAYVVEIV